MAVESTLMWHCGCGYSTKSDLEAVKHVKETEHVMTAIGVLKVAQGVVREKAAKRV